MIDSLIYHCLPVWISNSVIFTFGELVSLSNQKRYEFMITNLLCILGAQSLTPRLTHKSRSKSITIVESHC